MVSAVVQEDMNIALSDRSIPWDKLQGKAVMISGATGLIGRTLVNLLIAYGQTVANPPRVLVLVRNLEKAAALWGDQPCVEPVLWSAEEPLQYSGKVDYIIHGASQTSSRGFVEQPVDTIRTALSGTENLLIAAREKQVSGFIYLSSMEVYGTPQTDELITEAYIGSIDPLKVRNCYPEAKRMCESLCVSYCSQYGVPATIARLTQTFGPGVQSDDNRVFAEFARCAVGRRDIILHTKGETKRSYVYTVDAARAILSIMLLGTPSQAYNVANSSTYCTIYEMAQMVAEQLAGGEIAVRCELTDAEKLGYAPVLHMNLDTSRLSELGWKPYYPLADMFRRMIADF